jgi:transcriptional regulator with XRE-family HTH domain
MSFSDKDLKARELEQFGAARARDIAFDAVMRLWRERKAKGLTQKKLAESIGRDQGWLSRYFHGPGNWTLKTLGAFVQALDGELEITILPLEKPRENTTNSDAYSEYLPDIVAKPVPMVGLENTTFFATFEVFPTAVPKVDATTATIAKLELRT